HGFLLPAKPWAWYQHDGVTLAGSGWKAAPASRFVAQDGLFGLGGGSFTGGTAASTRNHYETAADSHFELWFLRQPGGGTVMLTADDVPIGSVDTSGNVVECGFAALESIAPASTLELHVTSGKVRVFGVSATRSGPGVVYDSLGLN